MLDPRRVEILLATYNGAEFVAEQIDSLLRQTYGNWRILARDDGSSDGTLDILLGYADRHPERLVLVTDDDGNLGYVGNFARLLARSTANYLAFCDQDDVWLADKLAVGMARMQEMERRHGKTAPLLVHSDLKVVDRSLKAIAPSFWRYRGVDPIQGDGLNRLLTQNVATGCTTLFNRPLADLCRPVPTDAAAHDWWVALVAGAFGHIAAVHESTILYRQHGGNTTGALSYRPRDLFRRTVETIREFAAHRRQFHQSYQQAQAFLDQYAARLDEHERNLVTEFAAFPGLNPLALAYRAVKWRIVPARRLYWLLLALLVSILPGRCRLKA